MYFRFEKWLIFEIYEIVGNWTDLEEIDGSGKEVRWDIKEKRLTFGQKLTGKGILLKVLAREK